MNDDTLCGLRLNVHVLKKILKFCTGSPAKSYQCKFTADMFNNRNVNSEELGKVIKEVIQTLRGKLSSVQEGKRASLGLRWERRGFALSMTQVRAIHVSESLLKFEIRPEKSLVEFADDSG